MKEEEKSKLSKCCVHCYHSSEYYGIRCIPDKYCKCHVPQEKSEISLAVEQEKERVLAMVLKEIEESKEECTECANREKHDTPINNALDTLKEKLQAKQ